MTKGTAPKSKLPPKKATTAQRGQEQSVGPLTSLLIRARQRILNPKNWSRGAYARDRNDGILNAWDPTAVKWCAVGSLQKEAGKRDYFQTKDVDPADKTKFLDAYHPAHAALERAAKRLQSTTGSITALNDGVGHAAVIKMYNLAIKETTGG